MIFRIFGRPRQVLCSAYRRVRWLEALSHKGWRCSVKNWKTCGLLGGQKGFLLFAVYHLMKILSNYSKMSSKHHLPAAHHVCQVNRTYSRVASRLLRPQVNFRLHVWPPLYRVLPEKQPSPRSCANSRFPFATMAAMMGPPFSMMAADFSMYAWAISSFLC